MRFRHLLLAIPLAVYLALPTRGFYWDGVAFAIDIEKGSPAAQLLHPNHLLYTFACAGLFHMAQVLGWHTRALFMMQSVNSVLAGLCVPLVYGILRRRELSSTAATTGALLFAFAATWWKFATDANAYIPAIVLLLCAYTLLDRGKREAVAALLLCMAMLVHQLAILFLPVALARAKRRSTFAATALAPVLAAYCAAYAALPGPFTINGFIGWVTWHSPDSAFSFNPLRNAVLSFTGSLRLFFGGRAPQGSIAGAMAIGAILLALALSLRKGIRVRRAQLPNDAVIWVCIYAAFLFFWMPQNTFYRLFYLLPLVVLICCALRNVRTDRAAPWLAVAAVCALNFVLLIYPQSRAGNNAPLRFALAERASWPPGTPIVFHRFHPDLWTISYFNMQASWISLPRLDLDELDRDLAYARKVGQPLWLEATAYDLLSPDPRGRAWLAAHAFAAAPVVFRDARHEFRFQPLR